MKYRIHSFLLLYNLLHCSYTVDVITNITRKFSTKLKQSCHYATKQNT